MFQVLEHPYEKEYLQTLQTLVLEERENFLNLIYNLTNDLDEAELDELYKYAHQGFGGNGTDDDNEMQKVWIGVFIPFIIV